MYTQMNKRYNIYNFPCFTHEQVKEINKKIKKNISQEEEKDGEMPSTIKTGKFFPLPCFPLMELVHPWIHQCQRCNAKVFGYDIYWDFHLEEFNYNVYGIEGKYDWHIDANSEDTPTDMKLTCILNLSEEPYEGGEFYRMGGKEKVKFDSGEALVLNSMMTHKVTPVTKGERITLTYWAWGPAWK